MKKLMFGAAFAVLATSIPAAVPAQRVPDASIVVVDRGRIYRECAACVTAQAQLQALGTQANTRAQQLGQPIQIEMQSIQQAAQAAEAQQGAARTTAEAAVRARIQALQTRQNTANQEIQNLEQNLQLTQAHVIKQISDQLEPIVRQVMQARNANLALDVSSTIGHAPALNVTNDVMARLNQVLTTISVTPMPQPATGQAPQQQQPQGR